MPRSGPSPSGPHFGSRHGAPEAPTFDLLSYSGLATEQVPVISAVGRGYLQTFGQNAPSIAALQRHDPSLSAQQAITEAAQHVAEESRSLPEGMRIAFVPAIPVAVGVAAETATTTVAADVAVTAATAAGLAAVQRTLDTVTISDRTFHAAISVLEFAFYLWQRTKQFRKDLMATAAQMGFTGNGDWCGHHMVGFARTWHKVHELMVEYGLDINDTAYNGIPLPCDDESDNPQNQQVHSHLHTTEYRVKLIDVLTKAAEKGRFVEEFLAQRLKQFGDFLP